jgi:LuxR family maltose regulon positive regulatory protein
LTKALEWVREQGLSGDDVLSYLREFEHITLARVLIARYRSNREDASICEAMRLLLERLLNAAEEGRRMGSVIEILVLQALAHQAQGNLSLALAPLARAVSLAEPEGYVRIFVDEGESMRWLLEKQAHGEGHRPIGYAAKLLAAFAQPATIPPSTVRHSQSSVIEPLSERELEVLQHIAAGLTNREIADRLYLSLFTVKAHARSIYDKLDAHSRTQAVAKARELGVLPQP